ncbi:MAG: cytochrome-c oxidase, cbb3-type subunit III [Reyranellaceae bacterium]
MPTKIEKDAISGRDTTGHEWDGIKELDSPLPKWWLYIFYATIVFSVIYTVLYPAWPGLTGYTQGMLGFSQRDEAAASVQAGVAQRAPMMRKIDAASLEQIRKDPEMLGFALNGGRVIFADNCATCHGAGGAGRPAFPVLADDDWLWGGRIEDIHQTIAYGVRNAHDKSRQSLMPRFGADGMLTPAQIDEVAEYVLSLNGRAANKDAAARGEKVFAENCVACHLEGGKGNADLGAKNLTNGIWLYGGDKAAIVKMVWFSRGGSMPAWAERFDPATLKMLAVYVHALGGGQ